MKRIPLLLSLTCLLLSCLSCQHNELDYKKMLRVKTGPEPNLSFTRYEDVLFHLDTTQFQQELLAIQNDFLPFLDNPWQYNTSKTSPPTPLRFSCTKK